MRFRDFRPCKDHFQGLFTYT
ncbi:MAG: hypothetical protein JWO30_4009, partial [Fibrobacteres bacterium]|nr:hypothetical protein [Fibrobacterota bacterium]